MGANFLFYVKTIDTHARAFLTLNILATGRVKIYIVLFQPFKNSDYLIVASDKSKFWSIIKIVFLEWTFIDIFEIFSLAFIFFERQLIYLGRYLKAISILLSQLSIFSIE